jgi:hypothetical protein
MRAVFTVDLPWSTETGFPDDLQIIHLLRSFGWEPVEVCELADEPTKLQKCRELAEVLFKDMPPTAVSRLEHVIFYGYLADDYTRFAVVKLVNGQITFRLMNDTLARLQTSTAKVIKKILDTPLSTQFLKVSNNLVVIYERGNDYVVMSGRVVPHPLKETLRSDRKSVLLTIVPLLLAGFIIVPFLIFGLKVGTGGLLSVSLERLLTALLTTALVSVLSLIETYIEIYRNRVIVW